MNLVKKLRKTKNTVTMNFPKFRLTQLRYSQYVDMMERLFVWDKNLYWSEEKHREKFYDFIILEFFPPYLYVWNVSIDWWNWIIIKRNGRIVKDLKLDICCNIHFRTQVNLRSMHLYFSLLVFLAACESSTGLNRECFYINEQLTSSSSSGGE